MDGLEHHDMTRPGGEAGHASPSPPEEAGTGLGAVSPADLAELVSAFTSVTARLQSTHDSLRAEVARLERELGSAREQLERSRRLAALGEMAAGIAHEVRNPLSSIALYARLLRQDLEDGTPRRALAEKIGRAVRAVDAVVGDVLSFARESRVRAEMVWANEAQSRAHEECAPEFAALGVVVVRHDAARAPLAVWADPGLLQRALVNVIRNAYQAMADGPGATRVLELDAIAEPAPAGGPRVVLRVRDSGPGVSPEVVARMFNPFFTTRAAGTGLGLAIVHRIVDAHGGVVRVRNAVAGPGPGGAVVELVLPGVETPAVTMTRRSGAAAA